VLTAQAILIVEDNVYLALDLCAAVEEMNGRVVGPVSSVIDAMRILDSEPVSAAILDYQLPDSDVTPVARRLVQEGVPYVLQTGTAVPAKLTLLSDAPVVMKPVNPKHVVAVLADHGRNRRLSAGAAPSADTMTRNDAFIACENIRRFKAQLQEAAEGTRRANIQLLLNDEERYLRHLLAGTL
jgi:DNA-binding response OmpR family regulator